MLTAVRLTDQQFIAFDIEATGIAYGHDRIVEFGAARFRVGADGQVVPGETFQALVDPGLSIPEVVTRITGLCDDTVAGKPSLADVWPQLAAFVDAEPDAVWLAHDARADLAYLSSEAARLERTPPLLRAACTLRVARTVWPKAKKFTLSALAGRGPRDVSGATFHRALADALHTRNIFADAIQDSGATTLGELGVSTPLGLPDPASFAVAIPKRLLPLVAAIQTREAVEIVYRGGSKGRTRRPMTPLAFFARLGTAHLRAWCHLDDQAKTFRCDRIERVVRSSDTARVQS